MGVLRGIEKALEGLVEGFFARALPGGGVQPIELGKRMVRTMDDERTTGADGSIFVPNSFLFKVTPKDMERLGQIKGTLRKELVAVALRAKSAEGWHTVGPPEIHIVEDEKVKRGTFGIEAEFVESAEPEVEAGPQTALIQMSMTADAELVQLGKTSRTWPISKELLVIGRGEGADVIIPDPGVSRRHAEIRREGDEWVLVDLGSTNGSEVNGKRVNRTRLTRGDRILFGDTTVEFRRP